MGNHGKIHGSPDISSRLARFSISTLAPSHRHVIAHFASQIRDSPASVSISERNRRTVFNRSAMSCRLRQATVTRCLISGRPLGLSAGDAIHRCLCFVNGRDGSVVHEAGPAGPATVRGESAAARNHRARHSEKGRCQWDLRRHPVHAVQMCLSEGRYLVYFHALGSCRRSLGRVNIVGLSDTSSRPYIHACDEISRAAVCLLPFPFSGRASITKRPSWTRAFLALESV